MAGRLLIMTALPPFVSFHRMVRRLAYSGLGLYYAQLAMNLAWTPLFFGMRKVSPSEGALPFTT